MSVSDKMTVAELKEYAEEHGVDLTGVTKKADIIAAIQKSEGTEGAATTEEAPEVETVEAKPKVKPELSDDVREALELRDAEQRRTPAFRRQEWFRYKKLGGKKAPWRRPRGMHSKMRMHLKYRPPVVRIGYGTNAAARGLHPSGFEEVMVHRPADLDQIDPKTQGARIGGTVGGKKQAAIVAKADELGIRIFNRGGY